MYITTALPYVNAEPHIGHFYEQVVCDTLARYFDDLRRGLALVRPRAHSPRPVFVVAVLDDQGKRRSERAPVAEAGQHVDGRRSSDPSEPRAGHAPLLCLPG